MNKTRIIACLAGLLAILGIALITRPSPAEDPQAAVPPSSARSQTSPQPVFAPVTSAPVALPPVPLLASEQPPRQHSNLLQIVLDRQAAEAQRLEPLLTGQLINLHDPADITDILELLADRSQSETLRNELINLLRRSHVDALPPTLLRILADHDETPRMRGFAVQHLGLLLRRNQTSDPQDGIRLRLVDALHNRSEPGPVRRECLLALSRISDPAALEVAEAVVSEDGGTSPLLDVALRCVGDLGGVHLLSQIRRHASNNDDLIAAAAIDALIRLNDADAEPIYRAAAASDNLLRRQSGERGLLSLGSPTAAP